MVRASLLLLLAAGCLGDPNKPAAPDGPRMIDAAMADAPVVMGTVFGDSMIEDGGDQHACGTPEAASFKTGGSVAAVHSLWIYLGDSAGDDEMGLDAAIYDTGGNGEPTTLLTSASDHGSAQLGRNQWHQLMLSSAFATMPNHIYWIAAMCPQGFGSMFTIRFKWLTGNTGAGACDATATECTEHGRDNENAFDTTWTNNGEFMPSTNSYYVTTQ